jgi:hypothetical protein
MEGTRICFHVQVNRTHAQGTVSLMTGFRFVLYILPGNNYCNNNGRVTQIPLGHLEMSEYMLVSCAFHIRKQNACSVPEGARSAPGPGRSTHCIRSLREHTLHPVPEGARNAHGT